MYSIAPLGCLGSEVSYIMNLWNIDNYGFYVHPSIPIKTLISLQELQQETVLGLFLLLFTDLATQASLWWKAAFFTVGYKIANMVLRQQR